MDNQKPPYDPEVEGPNHIGDEVSLTHSFTNYLNALYQGKFAYLNILKQGGHSLYSEKELSETQAILENTAAWRKRLFEDDTIFPKVAADKKNILSDEAKRIMALLEAIRPKNYHLAQNLETIFIDKNLENNPEHITLLVASFANYTYTRENYLAGGLNFAHHFGLNSVIDEATFYLNLAQQDIQLAHTFMNAVDNFEIAAKHFLQIIIGECRILPGAFRIFNNDIVALLNTYEGNLTYELMGIGPTEISSWKSHSIRPQMAADWKAHRINPADAAKWLNANSPFAHSPTAAAAWQYEGFTPDNFLEWAELGIRAHIATRWVRAGYSSNQAGELTAQGFVTPDILPKEGVPPLKKPET